jgi:hypothetical protein
MLARVRLFVTVSMVLTGCVDSQRLRDDLGGPPAAQPAQDPRKQTLASKVLAAIALERVTKRKPDPARFSELRGR